MDEHPEPSPELRSLVSELFGVERELAQQGSSLAQTGAGDSSAWLMLVEQATARLRKSAQLLEQAIQPSADDEAPVDAEPEAKVDAEADAEAEAETETETETETDADVEPEADVDVDVDVEASSKEADDDRDATSPEAASADPPATAESVAPAEPPLSSSEGRIAGHASVVSISDFVGFLSGLGKSGMLWVDTSRESFLLQLQDGAVIYAHGDNTPQGQLLGEILVRNESLPREKLAWALVESTANKDVIGTYLVRKGLITAGDLTSALAEQVQTIFDRLFHSLDATYQFELGGRLVDSADVRLNVVQLLLESARADDELRQRVEAGVGVPLAKAV